MVCSYKLADIPIKNKVFTNPLLCLLHKGFKYYKSQFISNFAKHSIVPCTLHTVTCSCI